MEICVLTSQQHFWIVCVSFFFYPIIHLPRPFLPFLSSRHNKKFSSHATPTNTLVHTVLKATITTEGVWKIQRRQGSPVIDVFQTTPTGHGEILPPDFIKKREHDLALEAARLLGQIAFKAIKLKRPPSVGSKLNVIGKSRIFLTNFEKETPFHFLSAAGCQRGKDVTYIHKF